MPKSRSRTTTRNVANLALEDWTESLMEQTVTGSTDYCIDQVQFNDCTDVLESDLARLCKCQRYCTPNSKSWNLIEKLKELCVLDALVDMTHPEQYDFDDSDDSDDSDESDESDDTDSDDSDDSDVSVLKGGERRVETQEKYSPETEADRAQSTDERTPLRVVKQE